MISKIELMLRYRDRHLWAISGLFLMVGVTIGAWRMGALGILYNISSFT
jgi:hypothetical protein